MSTVTPADAYRLAYEPAAPPTFEPRPALRRALRPLALAVLGFAVAIALATTVPLAFGMGSFTILSGSMEPAIGTGDVVVVDRIRPLDARVGDVVSFESPDAPDKLVTHRVVSMSALGDAVSFVTRGDANTGSERWSVPAGGTIGRVEYRIPKIGHVTNRLGSRFGRLAFIVLPAILLALNELWRIWRPSPKDDEPDR